MKKGTRVGIMIGCLLVYTALLIASHYLIYHHRNIESQERSLHTARYIYDTLSACMNEPVYVARAMGENVLLGELIEEEGEHSEQEMINILEEYLEKIRSGNNFKTAYVISDKTRRYYTFQGLNKIVSPETNAIDSWYTRFLDSGKDHELSFDLDDVNYMEWIIFVNQRLENKDGELLGVCGVGIAMSSIQDLFREYARKYGVNVVITDRAGMVLADENDNNIQTTYNTNGALVESEEFIFAKRGTSGYTISRYMQEFDCYLIIESRRSLEDARPFSPLYIFIALAGLLAVFTVMYFLVRGMKVEVKDNRSNAAQTDSLTGVPNRNYFKNVYGERGIFNTVRYKSIAVFDIDFFKEANDTMNGDEILKAVTECARNTIGQKGEIFRWGGDEFMVLMEWSIEFAYGVCQEFCESVERDDKVTVSVGVTEIRIAETIKKNYYRAAQGCYLVKELGGNGVKRI